MLAKTRSYRKRSWNWCKPLKYFSDAFAVQPYSTAYHTAGLVLALLSLSFTRVLWGQCQTGFSKYWHCRGVTGDIPKLCLSHWWFCFLRDQSQVSWGSGIVRDSSVTALLLPKAWRNAPLSLQPAGAREHGGLTRPQVLPWRTGSNVNLDDESEGLTEDFVVALETETRVQTVC